MEKTNPIYLHELHPDKQVEIIQDCLEDKVLMDAIESGQYVIVGYYLIHPITDSQQERGEG